MTLRPAIAIAPPRWFHVLEMIGNAVVLAVVAAHVAEVVVWSLSYDYVIWAGGIPVVSRYSLIAWLVGFPVGVAAIAAQTGSFASTRAMRVIVKALGVFCFVMLAFTVVGCPDDTAQPLQYIGLMTFALGSAISFVFRRRAHAPASRRMRIGAVAVVVAATSAMVVPTLIETHAEYRSQELQAFTLELAAAYPAPDPANLEPGQMPAFVMDSHGGFGEPIEHDGARHFVHRDDRVVITSAQVRRVRLFDTAVSIRIDADVASALRERSRKRMSQYDALYIDGQLVTVWLYEALVDDRLWLVAEPSVLRGIYDRLARD